MAHPIPKSGKVTHIIHTSDIHIRTGDVDKSRQIEYEAKIEKLRHSLMQLECIKLNSAIIVVLGDIFEHKNRIESPGLLVYNKFIKVLTDLAPTYVIQGNHDYQQHKVNAPDMITSLSYGVNNPNFYYFNRTGCIEIGNVGFGLVDIKETLKSGATAGQVDNLPPFPNDFSENVTTKIALFHGTIKNATLQNYYNSPEGIPRNWFDDYDIIMLGDVHLRQIHRTTENTVKGLVEDGYDYHYQKGTWAYPGSLVQQNFGEPLYGHGYLLWDLTQSTVNAVHVRSNNGMLNIKYTHDTNSNNSEWCGFFDNEWIVLDELLKNKHCPDNLLFKIKGSCNHEQLQLLYQTMAQFSVKYKIVNNLLNYAKDEDEDIVPEQLITTNIEGIEHFNSPNQWIDFIDSQNNQKLDNIEWKQWLKEPTSLLISQSLIIPDMANKINKRNDDLSTKIYNYIKQLSEIDYNTKTCNLNMNYINWQWILPYKNDCWFNFEESRGKLCTINAKNDSGKSSFLEIIVLGLFGESIPSRLNKNQPTEVICKLKPQDKIAFINTIFSIENIKYRLYRPLTVENDKIKTKQSILYQYFTEDGQDKEYKEIVSGGAISEWVKTNIGTIDSFLLSTMLTQYNDADFLSMDRKLQTGMLDKVLRLDNIANISKILKEARINHNFYHDQLDTIYRRLNKNLETIPDNDLTSIETTYDLSSQQENKLNAKIKSIPENWHQFKEPDLNLSDNLINQNITELNNSLDTTFTKEIDDLKKEQIVKSQQYKNVESYYQSQKIQCFTQNDLDGLYKNKIDRPACDQTWLDEEEKMIKQWENKWLYLDLNQEHHIIKSIHQHKNELSQNQLKLETWNNEPVLKPNKTIQDVEKLQLELTKMITAIKKQCNVTKITQLDERCQSNPIIDPSISREEINKIEQQLNMEKQNLSNQYWFDCLEFEQIRQAIKTNHITYQNDQQQIGGQIDHLLDELPKIKSHCDKLNNALKLHKKTSIKEPHVLKNDLIAQHKKYTQELAYKDSHTTFLTQYRDKVITYLQLKSELEPLEFKIKSVTTEIQDNIQELPFNPDCYACKQQPWRIKIEKLEQIKQIIDKQITTINNNLLSILPLKNINNIITKYTKATEWELEFEKLEIKEIVNKLTLDQWTEYEKYVEQLEQLETQLEQKQTTYNEYNDKLQNLTKRLNKVNQLHNDNLCQLKEADICQNNRNRWLESKQQIKEQNRLWIQYDQNIKFHQLYAQWINLEKDVTEQQQARIYIEKYNTWCRHKSKLQSCINELIVTIDFEQTRINLYEMYKQESSDWTERKNKFNTLTQKRKIYTKNQNSIKTMEAFIWHNDLKRITIQIETLNKLSYWLDLLKIKPSWSHKKQLIDQYETLSIENKNRFAELNSLRQKMSNYAKSLDEMKSLSDIMNTLNNQMLAIDEITKLFGHYKHWLYDNKIIPAIVNESNQLLRSINLENNYSLEAIVEIDNTFTWFINNGVTTTEISKGGGFRKFIFGLALRISLSYLGASKIACKQLFLDEGFVSADSNNLEKIPDFLQGLLSYYDSIILVSHLDILKDCGDINANINKFDTLSQMQFGKIQFIDQNQILSKIIKQHNNKSTNLTVTSNNNNNKCIAVVKKTGLKCSNNIKNGDYCGCHSK